MQRTAEARRSQPLFISEKANYPKNQPDSTPGLGLKSKLMCWYRHLRLQQYPLVTTFAQDRLIRPRGSGAMKTALPLTDRERSVGYL